MMLGRGLGLPFMLLSVLMYYGHAAFPWLFLCLTPWLGLLVTRYLVSLHFEEPMWFQEVQWDIKRMWPWLLGASLLMGSIPVWSPHSLFLRHGNILVWRDWFTVTGSPFKAMGMLLLTGTMLLEVLTPRALVLSYWVKHAKVSVPIGVFLETWRKNNGVLYLSGLGYVLVVYTLCALSPVFAYGAWLCLIDFYKRCIYESNYEQA